MDKRDKMEKVISITALILLILFAFACVFIKFIYDYNEEHKNDYNKEHNQEIIYDKPASQEDIDYWNRVNAEKEARIQKQLEEEAARQAKLTTTSYGSGLTKQSGVFYYNGMRETYYSSRVLYHHLTPTWNLDNEGFYHDADGYYVVSCNYSDHGPGEVFNTSKGASKVLDTGCDQGTVDFYVNW